MLSPRLTWQTALSVLFLASQEVANVPEVKSLPAPNQNIQANPKQLSLLNEKTQRVAGYLSNYLLSK